MKVKFSKWLEGEKVCVEVYHVGKEPTRDTSKQAVKSRTVAVKQQQGYYFASSGILLGNIGTAQTVFIVKDEYLKQAQTEIKNPNTKFFTSESLQKIELDYTQLKRMAKIINRETVPLSTVGNMEEKKALAGTIVNRAENYYNTSLDKSIKELTKKSKTDSKTGKKVVSYSEIEPSETNKADFAAAIYQQLGGLNLSNGANQWDGIDQIAHDGIKKTKGFIDKFKDYGISFSSEHYKTWLAAINTNWGKSQLKYWNKKLGTEGKRSFTEVKEEKSGKTFYVIKNSEDKTNLTTTACYGTTIFSKLKK